MCVSGHCADGAGIPKWPLRNGDFSNSQRSGIPTGWEVAENSGKHAFRMDPPSPFWNQPSSAMIESSFVDTVLILTSMCRTENAVYGSVHGP